MGIIGLLIVGLIFYLIFRFVLEEDFGFSGASRNSREKEVSGKDKGENISAQKPGKANSGQEENRPHPLRDKFSSRVSEEELIELARKRMKAGQITRQEFEEFRQNIKLERD